jgi:(E)-4-hydroxy-3-methylbut-2-enyl-diphosphate synthase
MVFISVGSPKNLSFVINSSYSIMSSRFKTREVKVGKIIIGGKTPVTIQSMTSTNTADTAATVRQTILLADAGCEMVRITAPGIREAENLALIKEELLRKGYDVPLIADIHFNPKAALIAASIVDKVRINPGNYTDRNLGKADFTNEEFQEAICKIEERIAPLIEMLKKTGAALRIGSNHGSLSERIISKYGNTPEGMVEAALEFVRICRKMDFHNIVLSMKASNVRVMVHATRLLVKKMIAEGMNYPIHLGVTEAGDAEDGRIKSAAGIGALLADGIGDTIRVSLTEDPVFEIPVAQQICEAFSNTPSFTDKPFDGVFYDPFSFTKREIYSNFLSGNFTFPLVIGRANPLESPSPDLVFSEDKIHGKGLVYEVLESSKLIFEKPLSEGFIKINASEISAGWLKNLHQSEKFILIVESTSKNPVEEWRKVFEMLHHENLKTPVILKKVYSETDPIKLGIQAALDFGPLFIDGFGDGIWLENENINTQKLVEISFQILQACGSRISKTEFIACPSCGRTQYDIQASLQKIKSKTSHLPGLKIAVMGCIVNGPGEMADADYGYVGMGNGKVALFKGKKMVLKAVPETEAVDNLIDLIKENGDWREEEIRKEILFS